MAWITDLRHFLDNRGMVPEHIPGPARNIALFLGSIVGWVSSHDSPEAVLTNVPCRRRPGRRRCAGIIYARFAEDGSTILWACPICGDNGTITGWEDSIWDRRDG